MNNGDPREMRDWWVVFCDGDQVSWMDRWQKPGYHHVYAARWDGAQWIVFQPSLSCFQIRAVRMVRFDQANRVLRGVRKIYVQAKPPSDHTRVPWMIGPITCVEMIKHLLGIRAWWIFTPWQLAKYLDKQHG